MPQPLLGVSEQRYVNSHSVAYRGMHELVTIQTPGFGIWKPRISVHESIRSRLVDALHSHDKMHDTVDRETPKKIELKLV